jgi:nitrogen regulatory protein P-II 1
MKLVTAIFKPERLDAVKSALAQAGVHGMTLSPARGFGHETGHQEIYRGARYNDDLIVRQRLEVIVADADSVGDGFVWVTPLDRVVRIHTSDENEKAL